MEYDYEMIDELTKRLIFKEQLVVLTEMEIKDIQSSLQKLVGNEVKNENH